MLAASEGLGLSSGYPKPKSGPEPPAPGCAKVVNPANVSKWGLSMNKNAQTKENMCQAKCLINKDLIFREVLNDDSDTDQPSSIVTADPDDTNASGDDVDSEKAWEEVDDDDSDHYKAQALLDGLACNIVRLKLWLAGQAGPAQH
ncbi:hypothetical protein BDN71DRAFT_1426581 [Pleurotus eryngii]|uniref:Uncharacterized protein n=1 Tax=Pleurotus eryngii TaxID=5323 RepID=A0A9P6AB94_PLEER|nr:hypothetical protein BDN71DRAFT_1426581 [Pleurotus eryngii]